MSTQSDVTDRSVSYSKTINERDTSTFSVVSGDNNPLHLDPEKADATMFDGTVVHGMHAASLISAALNDLAETDEYIVLLDQSLEYRQPVRHGEAITANIEPTTVDDGFVSVDTTVETADGETLIDGDATVLVKEYDEENN